MGNQSSDTSKSFSPIFQEKYQLKPDEIMIDSFSCALIDIILLQGYLYLTPNRIIFYSAFNNKTIFFGETNISIDLSNIIDIKKFKGAYGLNNSLCIKTKTQQYLFTLFVSRDTCYDLIKKHWVQTLYSASTKMTWIRDKRTNQQEQEQDQKQEQEQEQVQEQISSIERNNNANGNIDGVSLSANEMEIINAKESYLSQDTKPSDDNQVEEKPTDDWNSLQPEIKMQFIDQVTRRKLNLLAKLNNLEKYNVTPYSFTLQNTTLQSHYQMFFEKSMISIKDEHFANYWELIAKRNGINVAPNIADWNPKVTVNLNDIKFFANLDFDYSERILKARKPLKGGGIFAPKFVDYEEKQQLFFLDDKELVMIADVSFFTKFPLSDCFKYINCWVIKQINENELKIEYRYGVEFVKSTIFKGMVEKSILEEQKETGVLVKSVHEELKQLGYF